MSTTITFYLRTERTACDVGQMLRERLRGERGNHWIHVHAPDPEDLEGGRVDFGIEPTVVASIQPPRGESDFELCKAILATVHGTNAEMVALGDYFPLFSYRDGVLHVQPEDRELWEKEILPGFTGRIEYGDVLPWMEP